MHSIFILGMLLCFSYSGNSEKRCLDGRTRFLAASGFLDAAISSLNALSALVKKEAYRTRIASFNNPTSTDMGFSLETEVQAALRPLLAKARSTNAGRFSEVVASLMVTQGRMPALKTAIGSVSPVFSSLMGLVGNLAVQEKKITRADLDSFILSTSKYFVQYQRLEGANNLFDGQLDKLCSRMGELQFDLREYMLDLVAILYPKEERSAVRRTGLEDIFLKYLDADKLGRLQDNAVEAFPHFPADAVKGAKDIYYTLQKLFAEYQKIYNDNYILVKGIINDAKKIGRNINAVQVDASTRELEQLYNESRVSDAMSLRLATVAERLKAFTAAEQDKPTAPEQ